MPDLNRILEMARIFGVTTDYLLKDEIEEAENVDGFKSTESSKKLRKVTMEEADEFLRIKTKTSPIIAFGVSLCVASAAPLIALIGLSESRRIGITEDFASGIGVAILLVMVAVAVFLFILSGRESSKYEFLGKEEIETDITTISSFALIPAQSINGTQLKIHRTTPIPTDIVNFPEKTFFFSLTMPSTPYSVSISSLPRNSYLEDSLPLKINRNTATATIDCPYRFK